ncbi:MAG TPA: hypothetical protein ENH94_06945 [Phycisphaerales bacterium]|nr:hypothetical protein [Phycisphaerales bacterium]
MVAGNEYEWVFGNWLAENGVGFVPVDQQRRSVLSRSRMKSFDFMLYPSGSGPIIAELKGRLFKGRSLAKMTGLQCWVNIEDVRGLLGWEKALDVTGRDGHLRGTGWFIFAYKLENIDVETDGKDIYEFGQDRYIFYAIKADDYREFMKVRSPRWKTVTLPAEKFRQLAIPAGDLLCRDRAGV